MPPTPFPLLTFPPSKPRPDGTAKNRIPSPPNPHPKCPANPNPRSPRLPMRPRLSRTKIILALLALCCVCVTAHLVLLTVFPLDLTSSIAKRLVEIRPPKQSNDALKVKSDEQVNGEGLKESETKRMILKYGESRGNGLGEPGRLERSGPTGGESQRNASVPADVKGPHVSNQTVVENFNPFEHERFAPQRVTNDKINEMENQLIMAKAYLLFTPPNSNSHLVRELKLRIKELERVHAHASKDSDLSKAALQRMRAMDATLSKANKAYPDCNEMASKLRALTYNTEEQLRAQQNQATYLLQLATRTFPKGLHCLSMRLTAEYFNLQAGEREFPNKQKVRNPDLYHFAIFSDNVLACAVVINSTISNSMEPDKIVFHVVTDSLNFPSMMMWFLMNRPGRATIHIENLDEFNWLPVDFISMFKQPGVVGSRYTSGLNHLRFYLPEIFPFLNKVLLLDHDVVVQRDLRELWSIDMKGKVNGAVERCREGDSSHRLETLVDFSDPSIAKSFDAKACIWAYGMNMFDLMEWRRRGLTSVYHNLLRLVKRRHSVKAGSLPLGQLTFYNHTVALNRWWHVHGLGYNQYVAQGEVEGAAVIHYDGDLKPWLEIGFLKYRAYWSKFLNYNHSYLQECNIHE